MLNGEADGKADGEPMLNGEPTGKPTEGKGALPLRLRLQKGEVVAESTAWMRIRSRPCQKVARTAKMKKWACFRPCRAGGVRPAPARPSRTSSARSGPIPRVQPRATVGSALAPPHPAWYVDAIDVPTTTKPGQARGPALGSNLPRWE